MQTIDQSSIVYSETKKRANPTYQYEQILPNEGQFTLFDFNGGRTLTFRIPSHLVYNLSKSELRFDMDFSVPDEGYYNHQFVSHLTFFQRVQFKIRNGLNLVDFDNANFANCVIARATTRMNDLLVSDLASGKPIRINEQGTTQRADGTDCDVPYTEQMYINSGLIDDDSPLETYTIKLRDIVKDSLLELDKDLYFGKDLEIIFTLSDRRKIGYQGTSDVNVSTGATLLDASISVSNIVLNIAVEKDQSICDDLMNTVNTSGLSFYIPYPLVRKNTTAELAETFILENRIFDFEGQRLLRVYFSGFFKDPLPNTVYSSLINTADTNYLSNYHTQVNERRIQLQELQCDNTREAYFNNLNWIQGSIIQSTDVYDSNFFHCDDFSGFVGNDRLKMYDENVLCGMPIDKTLKYQLFGTNNIFLEQYDFYFIFVTQRKLTIKANTVTLE